MTNLSLRKKANLIIIGSFIGILIFFPFQQSFIGGLLFAAFTAATIGGLADTFAVNALFGQPLKIKWPSWMGTHIIARNRNRLIAELVDMVEHELLSTEMITKQLQHYNASGVVLAYLQSSEGKKQLQLAIHTLLSDLIKVTDPHILKLGIARFAEQGARSVPVSRLLRDVLQWSIDQRYDQPLFAIVSQQLGKLIATDRCKQLLIQFISKALLSYERNKKGRQFVNGVAGLNAEELSTKVQQVALQFLEQINDQEHPLREKTIEWGQGFIARLDNEEPLQQKVNGLFQSLVKYITRHWITEHRLEALLQSLILQFAEQDQPSKLRDWLDQKLQQAVHALSEDAERLEQFNIYVRTAMIAFVERNHRYIGGVVRKKLEAFSEQELIELVQEKAGKDLQFIRINGIVVGALIGIVLFLIHRITGGVFG